MKGYLRVSIIINKGINVSDSLTVFSLRQDSFLIAVVTPSLRSDIL